MAGIFSIGNIMNNWFKNLKLKSKMTFFTVITAVGILLTALGFEYLLNSSHAISLIFKGQRLHNVQYHLGAQVFFEYLALGNPADLERAYTHIDNSNRITQVFANLEDLSANKTHKEFVEIVMETFKEILVSRDEAELLISRIKLLLFINNAELRRAIKVSADAYKYGIRSKELIKAYVKSPDRDKLQAIQDQIDNMVIFEDIFSSAIQNIFQFTRIVLLVSMIFIITLLIGLMLIGMRILNNSITFPVKKLIKMVNIILDGDLTAKIDIESKDEIGQLALSLQKVQTNLQQKVEHTQRVTKGDFTATLIPTSDKDELSMAFINMTNSLREQDKITQEQVWLKTGQNDLSDKIRGEQEIPELSQNIISYITQYINAQIGAIFLKNESGEYSLTGSYAYSRRKNISNKIKPGEGLIGQCVLEKKSIILTEVPDDYVKINSGIGESTPLNVLVTPLLVDNNVIGVIELGSFYKFTDLQLFFMEQISGMLAISFQTAKSRIRMRKLLQTTQSQAEEMDMQREELRVTNEELKIQQEKLKSKNIELEKQTKILKDSETELQAQQEELRQTNEELEEKTESLEKYTMEVRQKNQDLRSAQLLLEERAKELEFTSKYKSEFLANMSHELRTPLNSMLILSKMLADNKDGNLTEKQVKFAATVHSAGSELLELINDILDLSKVEAGKMALNIEDFELKNMAHYIQQNYKHVAQEKGLFLKTEVSEDLPPSIRSDRQKVEQIIKNLISNSLKFTQKGGVTIKMHKPAKETEFLRKDLNREQVVCISVTDTGIGIPPEKQKLIFEAFQQADGTTSRQFGGTGLGLSISKEFANLLGGEIQLKSKQGMGSTFSLYLPFSLSAEQEVVHSDSSQNLIETTANEAFIQRAPAGSPMEKTSSESIRDDRLDINPYDKIILIIEDDARFAKILFDVARDKGFKCLIAVDGEAGLQLAFQFKPSAIILDIELPRMDGWNVMERLKSNPDTEHIPVHFISVSEKGQDAIKMGAIGFLKKPVDMEGLNQAFSKIESTLDKTIKKLLLVINDTGERENIHKIISSDDVEVIAVESGEKALELLREEKFDCLVADLEIKDIPGLNFVKKVRKDKAIPDIPVIVFTKKSVSRKEEAELSKYTESIILKSEKFMDRLLDETSLFLHRVDKDLPEEKQKTLKMTHNKELIFKSKKILIVDDDMRNVFALSNILEEKGMQVIVGKNGLEGLEQLKQNSDIDLVLMDIMMPEMDGYEAMKRIRQQQKFNNLPIIALTAKAMKGDRNKCINAGANDYMAKPVEPEKLLSLLRVWLYK